MPPTTTYTKATFKVREFRANGEVFSTFGDYDYKWEAKSIIDILLEDRTDGHTFKIIQVVETVTEEEVG
jgi:hypothetical protein